MVLLSLSDGWRDSICIYRCYLKMDGWMDAELDEWVDGWKMGGWMVGRMDECRAGWMEGWTDG